MQVAPSGGEICNQFKKFNWNQFQTILVERFTQDSIPWVRCAFGNVYKGTGRGTKDYNFSQNSQVTIYNFCQRKGGELIHFRKLLWKFQSYFWMPNSSYDAKQFTKVGNWYLIELNTLSNLKGDTHYRHDLMQTWYLSKKLHDCSFEANILRKMLVGRDVSQTTKERESKGIQFTILVCIQFCLKD